MKEDIILIGGGGHCASCIDVIEQQDKYNIAGIIDIPEKVGEKVLGYPVIGSDDDLNDIVSKYKLFHVSMGFIRDPKRRIELFEKVQKLGGEFPLIISPRAYVSSHASIEEGTIIMHDCLINVNVKIGKNCILNTKSLIEHDSIIGDNCHISTGAIINGAVKIGTASFIGSNATVIECVSVPDNIFIKAGSLVK